MIRLFLLLWGMSFFSYSQESDGGAIELNPEMLERAKGLNTDSAALYKDPNELQDKLTRPLMSDESLQTTDGTTFAANIGCKASNTFLKVLMLPTSSGDGEFIVEIDSDMDSNVDSIITESGVSGVCANGYISCDTGTWNNCTGKEWVVDPNYSLSSRTLTGTEKSKILKSCYCVNNSCGNGLAISNMDNIMKDFGIGIANAYQKINPFYTISGVSQDGSYMTFYGQEPASCEQTASPLHMLSLKDNPDSVSSSIDNVAFTESKAASVYNKVRNSEAATNQSKSLNDCQIHREFTIEQLNMNDVIEVVGHGTAVTTSCGLDCILLTFGKDEDNFIADNCNESSHVVSETLKIKDGTRIVSATLKNIKYDDWVHISAGENVIFQAPATWDGENIPSGQQCDLRNNSTFSGEVDITDLLRSSEIIDLTTKLKTGGSGEIYATIEIITDTATKIDSSVSIASRGRTKLGYEFDLKTGTASTYSYDGIDKKFNISQTLDMNDVCSSGGMEVSLVSVDAWNSNGFDGVTDDSVNAYVDQYPTCENNLIGKIRINDTNTEDSSTWHNLSNTFNFQFHAPYCELSSEQIINGCESHESNNACKLKYESMDSVVTRKDFYPTGLRPILQTRDIPSEKCSITVSREWFDIERTYLCENGTKDWGFEQKTQRLDDVVNSLNNGSYTDSITDASGNVTTTTRGLRIPTPSEVPECIKSCKTKKLIIDTQVNDQGLANSERLDKTTYEYYFHECVNDSCPLGDGEELEMQCGCLDNFKEAAVSLQVLRLAGMETICTSGEKQDSD